MITEFSKLVCIQECEILGISRVPRIVEARQLYHYLLLQSGFAVGEIARLCAVNHATVIHSINKVRSLLEIGDKKLTMMYDKTKNIKR